MVPLLASTHKELSQSLPSTHISTPDTPVPLFPTLQTQSPSAHSQRSLEMQSLLKEHALRVEASEDSGEAPPTELPASLGGEVFFFFPESSGLPVSSVDESSVPEEDAAVCDEAVVQAPAITKASPRRESVAGLMLVGVCRETESEARRALSFPPFQEIPQRGEGRLR